MARKGKSKKIPDALDVQFTLRVRRGMPISREIADRVYEEWARTGSAPDGYQVLVTEWANPNRSTAELRAPRGRGTSGWDSDEEQEERRRTLDRGGLFRSLAPSFPGIRASEGTGERAEAASGHGREEGIPARQTRPETRADLERPSHRGPARGKRARRAQRGRKRVAHRRKRGPRAQPLRHRGAAKRSRKRQTARKPKSRKTAPRKRKARER